MAGRTPKVDGPKAREGARSLAPAAIERGEVELDPPEDLGTDGRYAWDLALKTLLPARVVAHGDMLAFEAMCRCWERYKAFEDRIHSMNQVAPFGGELTKTPNGHLQMSALRISANNALREFKKLAVEFGLTPVARVRTVGTAQGDLFENPGAGE